jgi:hypothetical protein
MLSLKKLPVISGVNNMLKNWGHTISEKNV